MAQGDKSGELQLVKVDSLGRVRTTPEEREAILAAYDAGGLSGPIIVSAALPAAH